ncbi:MAG: hypothetical protein ACLPV4_19525 [Solirubrobacteraceae bacterium]
MATGLRDRADSLVGDGIEATVTYKHRRRLVDNHWRPVAAEQLQRLKYGSPPTHRLLELPGVSRRSRRLLGPLTGLLDDG